MKGVDYRKDQTYFLSQVPQASTDILSGEVTSFLGLSLLTECSSEDRVSSWSSVEESCQGDSL